MHHDCRKGNREKEIKYEVWILYYIQGVKKDTQGESVKLLFFWDAVFLHPDPWRNFNKL